MEPVTEYAKRGAHPARLYTRERLAYRDFEVDYLDSPIVGATCTSSVDIQLYVPLTQPVDPRPNSRFTLNHCDLDNWNALNVLRTEFLVDNARSANSAPDTPPRDQLDLPITSQLHVNLTLIDLFLILHQLGNLAHDPGDKPTFATSRVSRRTSPRSGLKQSSTLDKPPKREIEPARCCSAPLQCSLFSLPTRLWGQEHLSMHRRRLPSLLSPQSSSRERTRSLTTRTTVNEDAQSLPSLAGSPTPDQDDSDPRQAIVVQQTVYISLLPSQPVSHLEDKALHGSLTPMRATSIGGSPDSIFIRPVLKDACTKSDAQAVHTFAINSVNPAEGRISSSAHVQPLSRNKERQKRRQETATKELLVRPCHKTTLDAEGPGAHRATLALLPRRFLSPLTVVQQYDDDEGSQQTLNTLPPPPHHTTQNLVKRLTNIPSIKPIHPNSRSDRRSPQGPRADRTEEGELARVEVVDYELVELFDVSR
ncbi:hypothetical protein NMY22_g18108 [Coprinellus aureogranulatus]|nr:hypothetical protein NMY22_g18108 [Coprinellus aureogranulatus]